jgi:hypothetical protein
MVLVAKSPGMLAHLRSEVDRHLGRVGLELSDKTEPLPPMNEEELRNWLTARRGAGLTVSGEYGTTLACAPLNMFGGIVDPGEIDRQDSLAILYNRDLDDPKTAVAEVIEAVRVARRAEDLRFGDEASAAAHLWRCVAASTAAKDARHAVERMNDLWWETSDPSRGTSPVAAESNSDPFRQAIRFLIWFEGLERALRRDFVHDADLAVDQKVKALDWQRILAELVNMGLCEDLERDSFFPADARKTVRHMLDARVLGIKRLALRKMPSAIPSDQLRRDTCWSPALMRMHCSLAEAVAEPEKAQAILERAQADSEWTTPCLLFHEAVARMTAYGAKAGANLPADPLEPMRNRIENHGRTPETEPDVFMQVLKLWLPRENE